MEGCGEPEPGLASGRGRGLPGPGLDPSGPPAGRADGRSQRCLFGDVPGPGYGRLALGPLVRVDRRLDRPDPAGSGRPDPVLDRGGLVGRLGRWPILAGGGSVPGLSGRRGDRLYRPLVPGSGRGLGADRPARRADENGRLGFCVLRGGGLVDLPAGAARRTDLFWSVWSSPPSWAA